MSYRYEDGEGRYEPMVFCSEHQHWIPLNVENSDYKRLLQELIEGSASFEGVIVPQRVANDLADYEFKFKLNRYRVAADRLNQFILADGRDEISETVSVGESVNPETGVFEEVFIKNVIAPVIEPLEPTLQHIDEHGVTTTIRNPLIVQDEEERAAAQAIVDATPEEVKAAA